MKRITILLLCILCITSIVGLSSCAKKEEQQKKETVKEKVLHYSITADPTTLDPIKGNSVIDNTIGIHLCEPLVRNDSGSLIDGSAKSYEVSSDGLTYTFHIRNDSKWSDGVPLKAQDYEYGLKRLMDPETASVYAFIGEVVKNGLAVETGKLDKEQLGVKAIDDNTLVIELERPTGYFISMLCMAQYMPVRKDIVEKYGKNFAASADKNVYSGPFMLTSSTGGTYILERNPQYWNKSAIKLDRVEISVVADTNTALAMFEAGTLDYVEIPNAMVPQYDTVDYSYYSGANDYLVLNHNGKCKYITNKNFRLALNYAVDREKYNLLANNGVFKPNLRFVLPEVRGVKDEYGKEYPYEAFPLNGDEAKAKQYLEAAMKELGIANASDIKVDLLTTDAESSKKQAEVIQEMFQSVLGIKVTITQVTYRDRLARESKHEFEMVFTGWAPDYSDPYTYLELFGSTCAYNNSSYKNEKYDKLLAESISETDPQKRMDKLFEAEKTMLEDGAYVGLQLREVHYLKNEKLKGFKTYFVGFSYNYVFADIE